MTGIPRVLPLGLLTALIGVAFTMGPSTGAVSTQRVQDRQLPGTDTLRDVGKMIFHLTNRQRTEREIEPLTYEAKLADAACAHSRDMIQRDFFRHENPDGRGPSERVARQHRQLIGETGENIAGQSGPGHARGRSLATQTVDQWMDSPPHRKNILHSDFTHLGVCVVQQGNTIRATQVFARVRAYLASPLPHRGAPGDSIVVEVKQTFPPDIAATMYDFWEPQLKQRISVGPFSFSETIGLPNREGTFRLRLYFPDSGQYTIHSGPAITVSRE